MEADPSYITFFMFYMNMNNKPQQKVVVITGNSIMMDQDDTYTYISDTDLTEELDNYYTKVETEEYVNTVIENKQDKITDTLILADTVTGAKYKIQIQDGQLVTSVIEEEV